MEDEYEYACMKTRKGDNTSHETIIWTTKQSAEEDVKLMSGLSGYFDYRLVRRRKAGEIEIVDEA